MKEHTTSSSSGRSSQSGFIKFFIFSIPCDKFRVINITCFSVISIQETGLNLKEAFNFALLGCLTSKISPLITVPSSKTMPFLNSARSRTITFMVFTGLMELNSLKADTFTDLAALAGENTQSTKRVKKYTVFSYK